MKEEFKVASCTGKKLHAVKWYNEEIQEYRGVIQIVHGMQEHVQRYEEFAELLANCGYIVVAHDQLGHGKSAKKEEELGYFDKQQGWGKLVQDIHLLQNKIEKQYPNIPYVMFGHSMGSLLVRTYVATYQDNLAGIILSGTSGRKSGLLVGNLLARMIMLFRGEKYRSKLLEYLVTGSFNKKFRPVQTKSDWTTRDYEKVEEYVKDPLCGKNFTVRAYLDLFKGSYFLTKQHNIKNTPKVPILLFSGDKDPVGEYSKGVLRVYEMLQKTGNDKVRVRLFKDARHEMLNEINKEEVFFFVINWLDKNIK